MDVAKTFAIYLIAAAGELGGTYCYWRWLKEHGPWTLALLGLAALLGYAIVQTLQPETRYGRVYAAYAECFLVGRHALGLAHRRQDAGPLRCDRRGRRDGRRGHRALRTRRVRLRQPRHDHGRPFQARALTRPLSASTAMTATPTASGS